ncbi:hypothetical protein ACHAW5_000433 [Stephanodiscus triporus]|uniref:Methyltransferase FkbM domain-containing protein n=1 Tax=Stephanodiscus triporus TaxID=2934178 RepID=A0ABD3MG08_9STRA
MKRKTNTGGAGASDSVPDVEEDGKGHSSKARLKGGDRRGGVVIFLAGILVGIVVASVASGGGRSRPPDCVAYSSYPPRAAATASTDGGGGGGGAVSPGPLPEGFRPIYAYYGKFHHIADAIPETYWLQSSSSPNHRDKAVGGRWFAQHGQDVAVAKFFNFKRSGFFVDLAANDAVWASNTFSLEQNFGWGGICIEPNPIYWYRLSFRNCHVIGSIVGGETNAEVDVVLGEAHHGPFGGIVGKDFDNKQPNKKEKDPTSVKRYTVSLLSVLQAFNAPKVIDYISLDVEGAETYIMSGFPFDRYRFLCLTIERPKDELRELLKTNGYMHVIDFKRGDTLWAHESVYEEGKKLVSINPGEIDKHIVESPIPGY